jgi:hypothetical protein
MHCTGIDLMMDGLEQVACTTDQGNARAENVSTSEE